MLQPGQTTPTNIYLKDHFGKTVSLNEKRGKYLVLYFYPRDNTPGCTREAQSFRDYHSKFQELGVEVVGVSADSVESHRRFRDVQGLQFDLWSDPEHKLMREFDVWHEKTIRSTFVINPEGTILRVWEQVVPDGHAKEVVDYLETIVPK
jgi:peroxiredoxin Q/BCP